MLIVFPWTHLATAVAFDVVALLRSNPFGKEDRAGVAFASNAISKDHQSYLAHGGYGFIIGDGALNYGRENILEAYYTAHVWRGVYVSPGLQHVVNPGYNKDRGPVIIPTFRLHLEY